MQQTNIKVDSKIPRKKEAIVSKTWTTCDRPPTRLLTKCVVLDLTVPAHICAPHDLIKEKNILSTLLSGFYFRGIHYPLNSATFLSREQ